MKTIEIKGKARENIGKKDAKKLRKDNHIPCVLYGGKENLHFSVFNYDFRHLVYTPNVYIAVLDIGGKKVNAILQDKQFHPVTDKIIHADFYEVTEKEPVWIQMPVVLEGNAIGVLNGGRLVQKMRKVKVKGLLSVLPDDIKVDITNIAIGQSIKIADLKIEGLEFLEPDNAVVVLVKTARAAALAAEEEGEEGEESEEGAEGEGAEGAAEAPAEGQE